MKALYLMFAGCNRGANARLYDAASGLDDTRYREDCGAFFGSVHRTLNHLLACRPWHPRSRTGSTIRRITAARCTRC